MLNLAVYLAIANALVLIITGVSPVDSLKLSLYFWVIIFPIGVFLKNILFKENHCLSEMTAYSISLGLMLFPITILPFSIFDKLSFHFYIFAFIATILWVYEFNSHKLKIGNDFSGSKDLWIIFFIAALISIICFLSITNNAGTRDHFNYQAIEIQAIARGWPLMNANVAGLPLRNNFGVHLLLSAISDATNISNVALGAFEAQIALLTLTIAIVGWICLGWLRLSIASSIAVLLASYFVVGFSPINSDLFGSALPTSQTSVMSPLLGTISALITMIYFLKINFRQKTKISVSEFVFLALLASATMLYRSNMGLLIGCSASLFWIIQSISLRRLQIKLLISIIAIGVGDLLGLLGTLGNPFNSGFSGAKFLAASFSGTFQFLEGEPIAVFFQTYGFTPITSGALNFLFFTLFNASFLAPLFWQKIYFMFKRGAHRRETFLASMWFSGVFLTAITFADGGSNFVFFQISKICMCLLGGIQLDSYLYSANKNQSFKKFLNIPMFISIIMLILHLYDGLSQFYRLNTLQRIFKTSDQYFSNEKLSELNVAYKNLNINSQSKFILAVVGDGKLRRQIMASLNIQQIADPDLVNIYRKWNTIFSEILNTQGDNNIILYSKLNKGVLDLPCVLAISNNSLDKKSKNYLISDSDLSIVNDGDINPIFIGKYHTIWKISNFIDMDKKYSCH